MTDKQRTNRQNNSLHLLYQQLADILSDQGITVQMTLKHRPGLNWNAKMLKELWREMQIAITGKTSTTQLTTKEIDQVYEEFNRFFAVEVGAETVDFPSLESIMWNQRTEDHKQITKKSQSFSP